MNKCKFSVIIPCYNSWQLMERGLRSLEEQSFSDFEVIFVDDCSTDDTYSQLKAYQQSSAMKISVFKNEKNSGPGESRNNGIRRANGEYIAFLDSDDWYERDYLEKMYMQFKATDADMVFCDFYRDFGVGENRQWVRITETYPAIKAHREFIALCFDSLCVSAVRRKLFDVVSFPAIYNAEDVALLPVLVYKSSKVSFVSEPLYHYLYRPGSLSTAKSEKIADSVYEAFHFLRDNISEEYREEVCFRGIKMVVYGVFYNVIKAGGDIKKAESRVREFWQMYPEWQQNKYFKTLPIRKRFFVHMVRLHAYGILNLYCKFQEFLFSAHHKCPLKTQKKSLK